MRWPVSVPVAENLEETMRILDLSHTISADMPVYPGTAPPTLSCACTLERDGFLERKLNMYSHTGTHIDAPAHILPEGRTLDSYPPDTFLGTAIVIDCRGFGHTIGKAQLQPLLSSQDHYDYILLCTGWSCYWGEELYFCGYPVLSEEAALWLSGLPLKGVGMDTISVDKMGSETFPVHTVFLKKEILLIENLTNLDALAGNRADFICLPLKIAGSDGSPVRAMAIPHKPS